MKSYSLSAGAILLVLSTASLAGTADSTGGIKVKSEDGHFEGAVGGLINYDYVTFEKDTIRNGFSEGPFVRRAEVALSGKAWDFKYKLQTDLKGPTPESKDIWIGLDALSGFVKVGHMRPAYGMELLTPTAETLFAERPYISNNTLFAGREFQNGISYDTHAIAGVTAFAALYSANALAEKNSSATQPPNTNGHGISARVTWVPILREGAVLHLGVSFDDVSWESGPGANAPAVNAAIVARNGATLSLIPAAAYDHQQTPVLEVAGTVGRWFGQAEYTRARYAFIGAGQQTLESGYLETSFSVLGDSRAYKADRGVFGAPKSAGALELKARYDFVKNDDAATAPKAAILSAGANYYFNPNVRVMAEYAFGDAHTRAINDKPRALTLRGQFAF